MYVENRATKAERVKHVSKKEHYHELCTPIGMFKANVSHLKGSCGGLHEDFIRVGGHFKINRQL